MALASECRDGKAGRDPQAIFRSQMRQKKGHACADSETLHNGESRPVSPECVRIRRFKSGRLSLRKCPALLKIRSFLRPGQASSQIFFQPAMLQASVALPLPKRSSRRDPSCILTHRHAPPLAEQKPMCHNPEKCLPPRCPARVSLHEALTRRRAINQRANENRRQRTALKSVPAGRRRRRDDVLAEIHSGNENILSGEKLRTAGRHASRQNEKFYGAKQVSEPGNCRRLRHLSVQDQKTSLWENPGELGLTRAAEIRIIKI